MYKTLDRVMQKKAVSQSSQYATPRADVVSKGEAVEVAVEMPGVKKDDVQISVEKNVLTIKGSKAAPENVKNKDYYLNERRYGEYKRSFKLSDDLDAEKISASFENGVLTLSIAKKEAAAARSIPIQ
jgi:HSP20 family protein